MTEQTINELADFFRTFKQGETKQPPQSNLTYDDAVTYFFRNMEVRGLASETKHFYKDKLNAFRKFLVQIKKIQALETLTSSELEYYIDSKYSKNKVNTFNCHARALRAFFNYLERDGYLIANPARNVKPKKVRKEKIDYFTVEQVRKLLTSFDLRYKSELRNLLIVMVLLDTGIRNKSELRNLLIVMVLLDTGIRNSELVRIKLEDINTKERSIYIYATKTNTFRTVYYSKETERIYNVYRREVLKGAEKGPLFVKFHRQYNEPILDSPLNTEMVYGLLSRKAKKIFGPGFRMNPHKFRHTFATHFVINGGDPFSLRDLLGHTNIETTKIYVDMSPKDLKTKHAKHSIISNIENDRQAGEYHEK